MSFWESTWVQKSRRPHRCILCQFDIPIGSKYSRETGIYQGDFQDYCLCERCRDILDSPARYLWMDSFDNELLDFMDGVNELDLTICPNCGSRNVYEMSTSEDNLVLHVECEDCEHKYDVDVSASALIKKYNELREIKRA